MPLCLLIVPPLLISILSTLAYIASSGTHSLSGILILSSILLSSTYFLVHLGNSAIEVHAPNKKEMEKALRKSRYSLPFWSLVLSTVVIRAVYSFFGLALHSLVRKSSPVLSSGCFSWVFSLLSTNWYWSMLTIKTFITPTLGWLMLSVSILGRYVGPLSPFIRCSAVPLRINPFDARISRIGKNCTSKERFLDMIAKGLDVLASPSSVVGDKSKNSEEAKKNTSQTPLHIVSPQNNFGPASFTMKARYSRPGMFTIMIQAFVLHASVGYFFGHTIVLPFLKDMEVIGTTENATTHTIILLSCILGSVLDMLSSIQEAELRFECYSSRMKLNMNHLFHKMNRLWSIIMVTPIISVLLSQVWCRGYLFIHGHELPVGSSSMSVILYSIMLSFVATGILVGIMQIQDEVTRWAICAPDINPDLLLDKSVPIRNDESPYLAEDLYVQSILMGDGATAKNVLNVSVARSKGPKEDELARNEQACASFACWIKDSSTFHCGMISDDVLRMCLLQSIGGNNNTQEKTIIKRLHLSAATSAPRSQPIVIPLARSFLAFAGGLGESMTECFRQERKDGKIISSSKNSESWMVPPGSLTAGKYAIHGAARLIVTNSTVEERCRTNHLSLLVPCVLQSAYKLRCGIFEYALYEANMNGANLSTLDRSALLEFIRGKRSELMPVITACDSAAKMIIKCLHESGDEKVLLRWKGEMQSWIVDLNSQIGA